MVRVQTPSGPVMVSWEPETEVSVHGLAVFFIEFLHVSGVWAALRDRCRLQRTSPNAPDHESVVGRMVLAVLSGGNRYRHVDGVRSDVVAGGASGSVNFGLGSPMVTVYSLQSGSAVG